MFLQRPGHLLGLDDALLTGSPVLAGGRVYRPGTLLETVQTSRTALPQLVQVIPLSGS